MKPIYNENASLSGCVNRERHRLPDLVFWIFAIYLGSFALEGVLRYVFALAGAPNLIYFRDALATSVILWVFASRLIREQWIDGLIASIFLLLGIHFVVGLFSGGSIFQALFGAKIFLPLVLGVAVWPTVKRNKQGLIILAWVFFVLSAMGVFINYAIGILPWESFEYETAFGISETTREWWMTGGVRRLPGFARTSVHAAGILGVLGAILMAISQRPLSRMFVALAGMLAIVLTTSKGMVLIFAVISVWLIFPTLWKSLLLGKLIVSVIVLVSIIVPTLSILHRFSSSDGVPSLLISFWERLHYMWPGAFSLITSPINVIAGKGLGAIGAAQQYGYFPQLQNWADNVFVYFFVSFGILGYAYLVLLVMSMFRLPADCERNGHVFVAGLVAFFGYGLTSNMAEQAFIMALLGIGYGAAVTIFSLSSSAGVGHIRG